MKWTAWTAAGVLAIGTAGPAAADDSHPPRLPDRRAHLTGDAMNAPASTLVTFYLGLQRADAGAEQALRDVADPASADYRHFPSRSRIATEYGASPEVLRAVRASAGRKGLSISLDDTGVFAAVRGTAKQLGGWLGKPVRMRTGTRGGLRATFYFSKGAPPADVRPYITEFIPLDLDVVSSTVSYAGRNAGTPRSCLPSAAPKVNTYAYSYNQLRTAYGLDALPRSVSVGKRTRVTVMAQGDGFSRQSLVASALCFGLPEMRFQRIPVPGLDVSLPVGTEGNLDVQTVQAVLPMNSRVSVVESAGFDQREFLAWATAFSQNRLPHVITTSYGYCEPDLARLPPGTLSLTESVLLRLSLAGSTVFAAAGDRGSSDCVNNATGSGPKGKSVDYPASSSYVTGVGGTRITLNAANLRSAEVVWNATDLDPPLGPALLAGGGGSSRLFARPWWQAQAVGSQRRAVPDIAAHAATAPGWPIVDVDRRGNVTIGSVGGTSAAAPFVAATVGLIAADQKTPFGQLQPALYTLPESALFDITKGDNDLFDRGCCRAKPGFDRASGLGAPRFDRWALDLSKPR